MASLNFLIRSSQTLHNPPKSPGQVLHSSRPTALAPTSVLVTFCCSNKVPWPRLHGQRIYFGLRFQRKSTTGAGDRAAGRGSWEVTPQPQTTVLTRIGKSEYPGLSHSLTWTVLVSHHFLSCSWGLCKHSMSILTLGYFLYLLLNGVTDI